VSSTRSKLRRTAKPLRALSAAVASVRRQVESPEQDVEDRLPIWDCIQHLYMDTDVSLSYNGIVRICSDSKYTLEELDQILYNEVLPAVRFNMAMLPAPEWCGFDTDWLKERVLEKHCFGRRRPWYLRLYTQWHWRKLRPRIEEARAKNDESTA